MKKKQHFTSHKNDWNEFEKNDKTIALNILYVPHNAREIGTIKVILLMIKVGLSPPKKNCVICLIESPLMMKNDFYFILKALFVLKLFKFLSQLFGHVGKTA